MIGKYAEMVVEYLSNMANWLYKTGYLKYIMLGVGGFVLYVVLFN